MQSSTLTSEMKKAKTGFLLKEIFERFKRKSLSRLESDALLWNYFGHESTLTNILNALKVFKPVRCQRTCFKL